MRLLSGPLSLFGSKAEIALREKALAFTLERVPFSLALRYSPKHPDVVASNPKAQIPVLFDGATTVWDSTQIFEYLEHRYPMPPLWPSDPAARAIARQAEHHSDEVLFPLIARLMSRETGADARAATVVTLGSHWEALDRTLEQAPHIAGPFSYADIAVYLTLMFATLLGGGASDNLPALTGWRDRIAARPAVDRVCSDIVDYVAKRRVPNAAAIRPFAKGVHRA